MIELTLVLLIVTVAAVDWTPIAGAVVGLVGLVVGPIVGVRVAARRFSGQINSSEAKDLWDESTAIRRDLREQLNDERGKREELATQVRSLQDTVVIQERTIRDLEKTVETLESTVQAQELELEKKRP